MVPRESLGKFLGCSHTAMDGALVERVSSARRHLRCFQVLIMLVRSLRGATLALVGTLATRARNVTTAGCLLLSPMTLHTQCVERTWILRQASR